MGNTELLTAGVLSSCALVFAAPAALPEERLLCSVRSAFLTSLALACAFLLTDGARMLSDALWGETASVIICALFSFLTARTALKLILPEESSVFLPAAVAVLVLTQPERAGWGASVLGSVCTAAGVMVFITALSPVLHRIRLSESPRCVRGLPSVLIISGLCALAFSGL